MKYPKLVRMANTPCTVEIDAEEVGRYGARTHTVKIEAKCNYQSGGFTKVTADKQIITLSAKAYFDGDIAPDIPEITAGKCNVLGVSRDIYKGTKARNPDGSVNYTLLELV